MPAVHARPPARVDENHTVTPIELFFDLVFVFALTQVTATMADDPTAHGVVQGLLVVALLWWSWTGYAWLGNLVRADEGFVRLGVLLAMAGNFLLALAIPEAFADLPGGLSGPVVVAVCYFAVRAIHLLLFFVLSRDDPPFRGQVLRFAPSMLLATALLFASAGTDGRGQTALWAAALAADYVGTYLGGASGWRIRSPRHFTERHGLILIVALGESIVAIGFGVARLPISWPIVLASLLGLTLAGALWWAYFDVTAQQAEHAVAVAPEAERARLARDAYTFLHMPMVAGVVLLALGLKKVLEYVGDEQAHDLGDPLGDVALVALVGGVMLFLLAHVAFTLRTLHVLNRRRLAVTVLLIPLMAAGSRLPALASLALLTAAVTGLIAFESIRRRPLPAFPRLPAAH